MKVYQAHWVNQDLPSLSAESCGSTIHYAYRASGESHLQLAPKNLLMWKASTWTCEQGYQTRDLGRTACDKEGLVEFKRRWGHQETADILLSEVGRACQRLGARAGGFAC